MISGNTFAIEQASPTSRMMGEGEVSSNDQAFSAQASSEPVSCKQNHSIFGVYVSRAQTVVRMCPNCSALPEGEIPVCVLAVGAVWGDLVAEGWSTAGLSERLAASWSAKPGA
ncbi:MAG: hypothetical protein U9Q68_06310 [Euryarchaeota archaeon]|nr:hypothetical protein [Euryarchaeota archaeon]